MVVTYIETVVLGRAVTADAERSFRLHLVWLIGRGVVFSGCRMHGCDANCCLRAYWGHANCCFSLSTGRAFLREAWL